MHKEGKSGPRVQSVVQEIIDANWIATTVSIFKVFISLGITGAQCKQLFEDRRHGTPSEPQVNIEAVAHMDV